MVTARRRALLLPLCVAVVRAGALFVSTSLGSHGVLQRGAACLFGGNATSDVALSWAGPGPQSARGTASVSPTLDGAWHACLPALTPSGGPWELTVREAGGGAASTVLSDVYIGDVWLLGGQSNAYLPLFKTMNAEAECAAAPHLPGVLRVATVGWEMHDAPQPELLHPIDWQVMSAEAACRVSAVAFHFGSATLRSALATSLNNSSPTAPPTPIGVIVSAVDGTSLAFWTAKEGGSACDRACGPRDKSGQRYNAMISPLHRLPVAGVLWWQGESDTGCESYACVLAELIASWREKWAAAAPDHVPLKGGAPSFPSAAVVASARHPHLLPFVVVQLAPARAAFRGPLAGIEGTAWGEASTVAPIRAAQAAVADGQVPCVGLASAVDQGDSGSPWWPGSIHGRHKKVVGARLAAEAARLRATCGLRLGGGGGAFAGGGGAPRRTASLAFLSPTAADAADPAAARITRGPRLASVIELIEFPEYPGFGSLRALNSGRPQNSSLVWPYNSLWRLRFAGVGATGIVTTAFLPSAPAAFSARFNGTSAAPASPDGTKGGGRMVASVVEGSLAPDGFDLLVFDPSWEGAGATSSFVVKLDALWEDFPIAVVFNAEGYPMEPFSVDISRGRDGVGKWEAARS